MLNRNVEKREKGYKAFGLDIFSDIYFPELMPAAVSSGINIMYGEVPVKIERPVAKGTSYQISEKQLLFCVEGVGGYYVENGNKIVVQPDKHADEEEVRLFVLGTAFGALLLQRGIIPIHGSAVYIDGFCIVFTGVSGAGKSTLSSAFRKMGCPFLADDISAITLDSKGIPRVQPAYPQQKLCRDSMEIIGESDSFLKKVNPEIDKYAIPVHGNFMSSPARLAAVCELRPLECRSMSISRIFGVEKLTVLMNNIYRAELLRWFGRNPEFFKKCLIVASDTSFYRLTRPKGIFSLEEQVGLVRRELAK